MLGIILAGGKGRRMGGDKPQRELAGRPLIAWVIDALMPQVDQLMISGDHKQLEPFNLPLLGDAAHLKGPAAGLISALNQARNIGAKGLLVVPCDMPFLPQTLGRDLAGGGVQVPQVAGDVPIWSISCWSQTALQQSPDLAAFSTQGKNPSLRAILAAYGATAKRFEKSMPFFGVNTRAALEQAHAHVRRRAVEVAP
ncbi:MAG: molybdenum cofactor guanylyltransferase [Pseudomonadota bacterium]